MTDDDLIEVAPREVHDMVFECCRILGLDGAVAGDVARSVASIEIWFGDGLAAFDQELKRLRDEGGSPSTSPFVLAPDQWRAGELRLANGKSGHVCFGPAAPLAALGAVLRESLERGIGCNPAANLTGIDQLEEVELTVVGPERSVVERWQQRETDAMRQGLKLPRDLVKRMKNVAAGYLVSEAEVDAALGLTSSGNSGARSETNG